MGKTTITGNVSGSASTVSTGQQCGDNHGGPASLSICTQGMTVSTGTGDAQAHLGGTLQISTASAGSTCAGQSTWPCYLNDSSSINYPTGNSGYDVNIINVGFSSHSANPTSAQDCMSWSGNPNPLIKVATVSVATVGSVHGQLSGASSANGYSASFNSTTLTATVAVPGSPWVTNTGTQEAGMCISDIKGEDGIQVPFKIVT